MKGTGPVPKSWPSSVGSALISSGAFAGSAAMLFARDWALSPEATMALSRTTSYDFRYLVASSLWICW